MSSAMQELLSILDLDRLEHNLFRGRSPQTAWQRVFGGQTIGQALVAAQRTVDPGRRVHSLHGYFMRPGDTKVPIVYEVDRIRDGLSFNTRRVVAIQHGQAIFSLEASFQRDEDGLDHQVPMPLDVPGPEDLKTQRELLAEWPIQRAILAYLSDMTLLDTSTFPHGRAVFDPDLQVASLDHAMWFHRDDPLDDWLLYTQDSPSSSGSRGLSRGTIYNRKGLLVASVAQEGLIRLRSKA
jgi:acyl-CoA thioesterase II